MSSKLSQALKLNSKITLQNRVVMAPLTRCFADKDLVPTDLMADYYQRRADCGLIVSEATLIDPVAQGYPNTPGIYTNEQIEAWKKVTSKVHQEGGLIFCQLWHCGRVAHSHYSDKQPVAPSALLWEGRVPRTDNLEYEVPHAMTTKEVNEVIQRFIAGAENAIKAGFDGVEIHGANGYLVDQFLRQSTNQRTDDFGGSVDNRSRFALDIVDGIIAKIGSERTAIRLSPQAYVHLDYTEDDEKTYQSLLTELSSKDLAYVHLGAFNDTHEFEYLGGRASAFIRKHYSGTFVTCGSYSVKDAETAVENDAADLVALGRPFIANPDLMHLINSSADIKDYDVSMLKELI